MQVNNLLASGKFRGAWLDDVDPAALSACNSQEALERSVVAISSSSFDKWRDLPMIDFVVTFAGSAYIVELIPGVNRLVLAQLDMGQLKYDPLISALLHRLAFYVELKEVLMHDLNKRLRPDASLDSLRHVRERLEQAANKSGVNDAIRKVQDELKWHFQVTRGLRTRSALERKVERDSRRLVAEGTSEAEALKDAREALRQASSRRMSETVQR